MFRTPRKSDRVNKGVPPKRYGFEESPHEGEAEAENFRETEKSLLDLEISETRMKLELIQLEKKKALEAMGSRSTSTPKFSPKYAPRIEPLDSDDTDDDLETHSAASLRKEYASDMKMFMSRQTMMKDMKTFDGSYQEWPIFSSWWNSTATACEFTQEEALTQLEKCLKGDARETVQFLLHDSRNLQLILDKLEKRFGRPEFLIMTMMEKVNELPPVKEEKPESVMKFASAVSNLVSSLEVMGKRNYLDNPQLMREVVNKLPLSMKIQWSESEEAEIGSYVTMKTLAGWLNKKAEAAVNRMILCGECPKGKDKNGPEKKSKVLVTAEAVLKPCNLCNSTEHMAKDCGSFVKASVDQRWKILTSKKLCFLCLGKNHSAPECRKKQKCKINDCGKKHHEMLHKEVEQSVQQTEANPSTSVTVDGQGSSSATVSGNHASNSGGPKASADVSGKVVHVNAQATVPRMLMKILPVYVTGPRGTIKVYAFLDEGSTITMVKDTLADRMGLTGPNKPLRFQGASGLPQIDNTSKSVEMKIRGTFSHAREYTLYNVRTMKGMSLPQQTVNVQKLAQDWRFLSERPVEDMVEAEPEILIGLDNVALITSREVIHGPWDAPYLARTLLGWVIMGKVANSTENVESNYTVLDIERADDLYEMVKESFSTEAFEVKSNMDTMYSREDRKALKYMEENTKRASDGRFEAGLLWKEVESPKMPESRQAAFKRLQHTEKKLDRDKDLAEAYCQKIDDHLQKGYLKKLEDVDRQIPMEKVCCSPALASYAKEVNARDFQEEYPEAVQEILNHTYCDDYLGTSETTMEAQKLISDVVKVFKSGGFDIVNWCANDMQVLKNLAQDQLSAKVVNFESNVSERVLGMLWLPSEDVFTFQVNFRQVSADILSGERLPTMREVLRLIMSIFDPLGFIAVFAVKGKIFLQEMWKQKLGWDTEISGDLVIQWRKFLKELKEIEEVKVPRCFSVNLPKAHLIELHVFGDASEKAFAAVAYLRIVFDEGSDVSLVCARSRVAPLKQMSIPRMELQAAVLCVRLAKTIREFLEVRIDNVVFWSDSMTVLKWIRNDNRRFKDFVAHRLGEIEENSEVKSWRWVPTKMNVADLATRASTSDLSPESVWFRGPSFLKKDSSQWPEEKCSDSGLESDEVEIVKTIIKPKKDVKYPLPDVKRFSKWWRLLRATAQVRNIANFWLQKVRDRLNHNSVKRVLPSLTVEHIREAESEWYKEAQSEYHGLSLTDKKSRVYGLSPFYDDEGVLRMNSRLTNSEFPGKFPIILPPKHKVTRLLIMESHERHLHCGREQVLNVHNLESSRTVT
ncbi:uncharacterized protein LOC129800984 [Phlebotomus papatasi]|uniref:uncharacterized protein LOC129800984 n=1 Tax=Phlebotomus papatasi TaxID=29031 RepID=UPI0024840DDA|nr:uncharacterized protein LOC129800984 [Phlebotomus papatasi]